MSQSVLFFCSSQFGLCSGTQPQESCLTWSHTWCPFLHHPSAHHLLAISLPILALLNLRPSRGHRVCVGGRCELGGGEEVGREREMQWKEAVELRSKDAPFQSREPEN